MLYKKKIACASLLSLGVLAGSSFVGNSTVSAAPPNKDFQSIVDIKKQTEQNRIKSLTELKITVEQYGNKYDELDKIAKTFFSNSNLGSALASILDSKNNNDFLKNLEENIAKLERGGKIIDKQNLEKLIKTKTELDVLEYKIYIYVTLNDITKEKNRDFAALIHEVNQERNRLNTIVKDFNSVLTKKNAHEYLLSNQIEYFVEKFNK